jgi:hypothetical protein
VVPGKDAPADDRRITRKVQPFTRDGSIPFPSDALNDVDHRAVDEHIAGSLQFSQVKPIN